MLCRFVPITLTLKVTYKFCNSQVSRMYPITHTFNRSNEVYSVCIHTNLRMAVKLKNQVWLLKTLSSIKVDTNFK